MILLPLYNKLMRLYTDRDSLPYIHMQSGAKFRHQWPKVEDICIEDIAHNLSKICRYVGSIEGDDTIYSVAEHSVRASYIRPQHNALWKLMHDSAEAYCSDLTRPLKRSVGMSSYRFYEGLAMESICETFGMDKEEPAEVKNADKIMLVTEKRDLFSESRVMSLNKTDDVQGIKPLPEKILPWTPEYAKNAFLMRYYELTGDRFFYYPKPGF